MFHGASSVEALELSPAVSCQTPRLEAGLETELGSRDPDLHVGIPSGNLTADPNACPLPDLWDLSLSKFEI